MDKKQIIILIGALAILVGGIFFVSRIIVQKSITQSDKEQNIEPSNGMVKAKKESGGETLTQVLNGAGAATEKATADALGTIEVLKEGALTVKQIIGIVTINVTDSTKIEISDNEDQATAGKLADLKVGDSVKITYDKTTKNAITVSATKGQVEEKKD